ncbi:LysE family translocator [Xinfangfangia sp. D13-10-4-6]|uniref:LysE family translocator n=1 Tax=Pseudogemmobacter hezensis TaxID=2737662 RepID=UPI0015566C74|nr:LysE family translocator [Pseudogemmobacter hezensis]NPD17345.1 LysE family translocator [Pseudogemmobacter hezensis]
MTYDAILALLGFAFATTFTPGPNNMMLITSGVNFGLRRTVPHMLGITLGVVSLVLLTGLGVAGLFHAWPPALTVLKLLSVAYMLWLAWKIANAAAPGEAGAKARPMTLLQAAAFQWVNPKAWAMALGGVAAYIPHPDLASLLIAAAVFAAVSVPSTSFWAAAGQGLRRWLAEPARLRAFNWGMAVLLILSLWPVITMKLAS